MDRNPAECICSELQKDSLDAFQNTMSCKLAFSLGHGETVSEDLETKVVVYKGGQEHEYRRVSASLGNSHVIVLNHHPYCSETLSY